MSAATKRARQRARRKLGWLMEVVDYAEQFVEFPGINFPSWQFPSDPQRLTDPEVEEAAQRLRRFWGLGDGPISNVMHLLENNGAVIASFDLDAAKLEAFSNWGDEYGRPFVVLGSTQTSAARLRFNAAHELGHLILHRNVPPGILRRSAEFKAMELQAHRFAGAFLLPENTFSRDFLVPTLSYLQTLKKKWNVSIGAMIMRASALGLIGTEQADRLWRYYARKGYKRTEPLDDTTRAEQPALLRQSFELIVDNQIQARTQIPESLLLDAADIEKLAMLPAGFFLPHAALRSRENVVPFRRH